MSDKSRQHPKQRTAPHSLVRLVGRSDGTSPLRPRTRGAAPRFGCEAALPLPASGRRLRPLLRFQEAVVDGPHVLRRVEVSNRKYQWHSRFQTIALRWPASTGVARAKPKIATDCRACYARACAPLTCRPPTTRHGPLSRVQLFQSSLRPRRLRNGRPVQKGRSAAPAGCSLPTATAPLSGRHSATR